MQNRKIKQAINVLAVIVIAAGLLMTSLAYFSDSDEKLNTFTVGKLSISLDEPLFDELTDADKVLLPGATVVKDPTVTVLANSEDSYVFMLVDTKIKNLFNDLTINNAWQMVEGFDDNGGFKMMYVYVGDSNVAKVVPYTETDLVLEPLFEQLTVKSSLDNADFMALTDISISVKAFAHQALVSGTPNYTVARDAAYAHFFD